MNNEDKKIPPYFYFYTKYCNFFDLLPNEQAGEVIKHICNYVRQREDLPTIDNFENTSTAMLIEFMKQDIDHAFKKYRAQCENGKKGGAPKGNKNAAKAKSNYCKLEIDEINKDISFRINIIYEESKHQNFNISEYYTTPQIAEIVSCYNICGYDSFKDFGCTYATLEEYTLNESASKVCKELKQYAKELCDEDEKNNEESFSSVFAKYKKRAISILKFPFEDIAKFSDKCFAVLEPDFYSDKELSELFTKEEITEIHTLRNNPKTTQNKQIKVK